MDITPIMIGDKVVEIGDHVQLKSGGPKMTIIGFGVEHRRLQAELDSALLGIVPDEQDFKNNVYNVRCIWIGEDSIGCHDFAPFILARAEG